MHRETDAHFCARYANRTGDGFRRKTTFDGDQRSGELDAVITRAKAGDQAAIRYLYARYADNVFGYCRSIVHDSHEAEDVVQEVFIRVMSALRSYEPRGVPFSSWLLRIAHNIAIDHLRRKRAQPCEEPRARLSGDSDLGASLCTALRDSIAELPEGQREVIILRHIHGWSPPEIAQRLGKSEEAVHGLHHRGRRALQGSLRARATVPITAAA